MAAAGNTWEVFRSWKNASSWAVWRQNNPEALKVFNAVHKLRKDVR